VPVGGAYDLADFCKTYSTLLNAIFFSDLLTDDLYEFDKFEVYFIGLSIIVTDVCFMHSFLGGIAESNSAYCDRCLSVCHTHAPC